ncbi:MAG: hypothetical protein R8G34_18675 [Paracoccaceae bacterium]|nr:hypothetical protein [Paracoccaceae bacterium]
MSDIVADMKVVFPLLAAVETTVFRITAHVLSRLLSRDIKSELDRLDKQPKSRSYCEAFAVFGSFFALALLAASFGVWGLFIYFAVVIAVFR